MKPAYVLFGRELIERYAVAELSLQLRDLSRRLLLDSEQLLALSLAPDAVQVA